MENLKEILQKSGITVSEFSEIVGVSRVVAYKWIKGSKPHKLREQKVSLIVRALSMAVENKELPMGKCYDDNAVRITKIKSIIVNEIKKRSVCT